MLAPARTAGSGTNDSSTVVEASSPTSWDPTPRFTVTRRLNPSSDSRTETIAPEPASTESTRSPGVGISSHSSVAPDGEDGASGLQKKRHKPPDLPATN